MVPAGVLWSVALFLVAWTAGGLYYAGRLVAQVEIAVAELQAVKLEQKAQARRITVNRQALVKMGALDPGADP